jgi:cation diffusion facilitator family transporter
MTPPAIELFCHDHDFSGASRDRNERRTRLVILLTAVMMVIEIAAGFILGSMALLADGWHMASHTAALSITALGYWLARRHATDPRFSFGTGKVGDIAGFASALLLAFIAALMGYESVMRLFNPVPISFNQAILVAVIGLAVNLASALILKESHEHGHDQAHGQNHQHHTDHNLKSAYMHVVADALTSLLAIAALAAGKYLGWAWMDPAMGIVGCLVIARWAWRLISDTGKVLLDMNGQPEIAEAIGQAIGSLDRTWLTDLHLWRLGPGHLGAIVTVVAAEPQPPAYYKGILAGLCQISHLTVEVHPMQA